MTTPKSDYDPVNVAVGRTVAAARKLAGYQTRKSFYEKLGMARATYESYESGERSMRIDVLARIAKELDTTAGSIIRGAQRHFPEAFGIEPQFVSRGDVEEPTTAHEFDPQAGEHPRTLPEGPSRDGPHTEEGPSTRPTRRPPPVGD